MKQFFKIIIIASILLCPVACGNHRKPSTNKTAKIPQKTAVTPKKSGNSVESPEEEKVRPYKFLDFYFDGTKDSFLREIKKSKFLVLRKDQNSEGLTFESRTTVVNALGADWGLTIKTDSLENVKEVILITSNTSREIFKRASTELLTFFGEPWLLDTEDVIRWSTFYCDVFFRHLRSDDGCWIIMFELNDITPTQEEEYCLNRFKDVFKKFQEDVRSKDREKIASYFRFPFDLGYPLPEIKDKDDFLAKYELIFDNVIEEEILYSNRWCRIPEMYVRHVKHKRLLSGEIDNNNLIITSFDFHPAAYYKALEEEINIQRQMVHPSLRDYRRPLVVARPESYIFRVDEIQPGEMRLALWKKGKTMKNSPDYVAQNGFLTRAGLWGIPDWMFINGKDTVWVGYDYSDNGTDYYTLKRVSGKETILDIKATDFED